MCGKFTAKASWTEIVDFIYDTPPRADDDSIAYRVMSEEPVIVRDADERRVMMMRWGFPDPKDWRRPRPIHARGDTVDTIPAFAAAFADGQRGIVLVETFNEAPESGAQHTDALTEPAGIAFVWRRFQIGGKPMLAAVMVTVPANRLLAGLPTDRMPAILAPQDWAAWLGENGATAADAKACLKTVEDVRWTMTREQRARAQPARPPVAEPPGLFEAVSARPARKVTWLR
jgi:putative SOS response-associated peptidase YedK